MLYVMCLLKRPKGNDDVLTYRPGIIEKDIVLKPFERETELTQEKDLSM